MRPVLLPAARRLWRDGSTLQVGHPSGRSVLLIGVHAGTKHVLALLDGTRSRAQVLDDAERAHCPPGTAGDLLDLLEGAGLLVDAGSPDLDLPQPLPDLSRPSTPALERVERDRLAPDLACLSLVHGLEAGAVLRARRRSRVLVRGAGRVGAPLAALLAAAGVGAVDVQDDGPTRPEDTGVGGLGPRDTGQRRAAAAREQLRLLSPSAVSTVHSPDLVVLTGPVRGGQQEDADLLVRAGVAHLIADVREQVGVVGPLVLPGRTACLHCLDLTRTDLDPQWPALAAQLALPTRGPVACDGVLAVAVAAQAALQALALLEGALPATADGTLELALPGWRWRRRSWPRHRDCPCAWQEQTRAS
jgi:hypothetical protein